MKKLFSKLILVLSSTSALFIGLPTAWADGEDEGVSVDPCNSDSLSPEDKLNCLFGDEEQLIEASPQGDVALPHGDITTDFLPFFINTALSIAGTLIFAAIVYAGALLVVANDNEEDIEKAKKILIYAVIGAALMATSYALIYGVANLDLD